jgi:hypothetical protein
MLCSCRIAALIALAFYLQSAAWNAPVTRGGADGECYYLRSGVFRRAAILSLVSTAFGIVSYILLARCPHGMAASAGYGYKSDDGHYPPTGAPGSGYNTSTRRLSSCTAKGSRCTRPPRRRRRTRTPRLSWDKATRTVVRRRQTPYTRRLPLPDRATRTQTCVKATHAGTRGRVEPGPGSRFQSRLSASLFRRC